MPSPSKSKKRLRRRAQVIEAIRTYWAEHHHGPTYDDLRRATRIKSPNGVRWHLRKLRDEGLVTWDEGLARTIRLTATQGG